MGQQAEVLKFKPVCDGLIFVTKFVSSHLALSCSEDLSTEGSTVTKISF